MDSREFAISLPLNKHHLRIIFCILFHSLDYISTISSSLFRIELCVWKKSLQKHEFPIYECSLNWCLYYVVWYDVCINIIRFLLTFHFLTPSLPLSQYSSSPLFLVDEILFPPSLVIIEPPFEEVTTEMENSFSGALEMYLLYRWLWGGTCTALWTVLQLEESNDWLGRGSNVTRQWKRSRRSEGNEEGSHERGESERVRMERARTL